MTDRPVRPAVGGLRGALMLGAAASVSGFVPATSDAMVTASVPTTPSWKVDMTSIGAFNVLSCASTRFCIAVGTSTSTDNAVKFNDTRWGTVRQLEQYAGEVVLLSCPTVGWCVALTDLAGATVLHDGRWSQLTTIDPNPGPPYSGMANAVSRTSSRFCVAGDAQGNAETYICVAVDLLSGGNDTTVLSGHCYEYEEAASDNVGNGPTTSTTSSAVKVDTGRPDRIHHSPRC